MKLLHDISIAMTERWLWAAPYGLRGRPLGPGADRWNPMKHAYLVERGTPPGMDGWNVRSRRYWTPFTTNAGNIIGYRALNPACGPIRSSSGGPHLQLARPNNWGRDNLCLDCQRLHADTTFYENVIGNDPWGLITWRDREFTPDPVSGL